MLLLVTALAFADSPHVLSKGASVVYGGVGFSTFQTGVAGGLRDRQYRARIDTYAARGLTQHLQVAVDVPLVRTGVLVDHEDRSPCPRTSDYCDSVTTVGEIGVHLRGRIPAGRQLLAADIGVRTDRWNAGTRHRWTNAGQGTVTGLISLLGGIPIGQSMLSGAVRYGLVVGRPVDTSTGAVEWLPPDYLASELRGQVPVGPLHAELGLTAFTRLGGTEPTQEWTGTYPSADLWSALRYRELRAEGKVSIPLGPQMGVHVNVGRIVWVDNGPKDTWDASIGVHRYWSGPNP